MKLLIKKLSISTISAVLAINLASCGSDRADDLTRPTTIIPDQKPLDRDNNISTNNPDIIDNDRDQDGLLNDIEDNSCTDPDNPDTDEDGLLDGLEDSSHNGQLDIGETDPCNGDTDSDGLLDGIEDANHNGKVDSGETDPLNPDTDGDWLLDGIEDANHNGIFDKGETDPLNPDTDGDGLLDGIEDLNRNGNFDKDETDPLNPDTDGDLIIDGVEDINQNGIFDDGEIDPRNHDTDGDGLGDGIEDKDFDAIFDDGETNPLNIDTDSDGLADGLEDANHNGIWEIDNKETDPRNPDTDGDDLIDGIEDNNTNGKFDNNETDPLNEDTDGDNLWDGNEVKRYGTNAVIADSDDDGLDDGFEVYSCTEKTFDTIAISEHNASNKNTRDVPDLIDALDLYNDSDEDNRTNIGEKLKGTNPCDPNDAYPWITDVCKNSFEEGIVYIPGGFDVDGDGEIEPGFWLSQYPASPIKSEEIDIKYDHFEDIMNEKFNTLGFDKADYTDGEVSNSNDSYKVKFTDEGADSSKYMSSMYAMDVPLIFQSKESCTIDGEVYASSLPSNKQYQHLRKLLDAYTDDSTTVQNSILGNDINVQRDYKVGIFYLGLTREYTKDIVKIEGFEAPGFWDVGDISIDESKKSWADTDIGYSAPGFVDPYAVIVRQNQDIDLTFSIGSGESTKDKEVIFRSASDYVK